MIVSLDKHIFGLEERIRRDIEEYLRLFDPYTTSFRYAPTYRNKLLSRIREKLPMDLVEGNEDWKSLVTLLVYKDLLDYEVEIYLNNGVPITLRRYGDVKKFWKKVHSLAKMLGLEFSIAGHSSTDPCDDRALIHIEIEGRDIEDIISETRECFYQDGGKLCIAEINGKLLIIKKEEKTSYDSIMGPYYYTTRYIVIPIDPIKIRYCVTRISVVCGPDGNVKEKTECNEITLSPP